MASATIVEVGGKLLGSIANCDVHVTEGQVCSTNGTYSKRNVTSPEDQQGNIPMQGSGLYP
eukprot:scaffold3755_cov52-Cylindrotheca_fusiformis.AAC.4